VLKLSYGRTRDEARAEGGRGRRAEGKDGSRTKLNRACHSQRQISREGSGSPTNLSLLGRQGSCVCESREEILSQVREREGREGGGTFRV
jgi:hypothetical protein